MMMQWLENSFGSQIALTIAGLMIVIAVIIVFFLIRAILRFLSSGTFVKNGLNRKKRLSVIDAAPVDNRRRLVLVRRDDVEHLVLIGGMNDLVIENNIQNAQQIASAPTKREKAAAPDPASIPAPENTAPRSQPPQPKQAKPPAPEVQPKPRQQEVRPAPKKEKSDPAFSAKQKTQPAKNDDLNDMEFDIDISEEDFIEAPSRITPPMAKSTTTPNAPSAPLDDEMEQLLNQLSNTKN